MTSRRSPVNFRADDYAPPAPSVAEQLAGTLFDPGPLRPLPTERRPEVAARGAEQRTLPLDGTAAGWYARWRRDPRAVRVLEVLRAEAIRRHQAQPRQTIGPRNLWERVRQLLEPEGLSGFCDNRAQSRACREVEETTPALRGRFRHRVQKE